MMDEMDGQPRMPQEPTSNLFLAAGAFGLLAFFLGGGLILASGLGLF
jgi:hypothetical protein